MLDGAAGLFGGGAAEAAPAVDVKVLHAKIGELTLENDFLTGALSKVGSVASLCCRPGRVQAATWQDGGEQHGCGKISPSKAGNSPPR